MSGFAREWAWRQKDLTPTEKCVLVSLCDFHTEKNGCFPALKTIAEIVNVGADTVLRALASLEGKGLIKKIKRFRENGGNKSNFYEINFTAIDVPISFQESDPPLLENPIGPSSKIQHEPKNLEHTDTKYRAEDPPDEAKIFWDEAILMAEALGILPKTRNSLIGRLLKIAGKDYKQVMAAMEDAVAKQVADPVPWLIAAVGGKKKSHAQQQKDRIDDAFEQLRLQGERRRAALEAAANEGHASGGGGSENYGEFQLEPSEEPRSVPSERRLGPPTIPALYTEDVSRSGGWDFE